MSIPAVFKPLTPYLKRAEELDQDASRPESKLVAYFCRQFAVEIGISIKDKEPEKFNASAAFLFALMDTLESTKTALPPFTQDEGRNIAEGFALEIFQKADDEDRNRGASKDTARTFYAAGTFFDILQQFGTLAPDINEKRKYAKFKAQDILNAIKEGRTPRRGGPNEEQEDKAAEPPVVPMGIPPAAPVDRPSETRVVGVPPPAPFDIPATPTQPPSFVPPPAAPKDIPPAAPTTAPVVPPAAPVYYPPAAPVAPPVVPAYTPPPASAYVPPPTGAAMPVVSAAAAANATPQQVADALELAKFAVSALKHRELPLAVDRLTAALRALQPK